MAAGLVHIDLNTRRKPGRIRRVNHEESNSRIAHTLGDVHPVGSVSIHEKIFNAKCSVDDSNELRNVFAGRFAHGHRYVSTSAVSFGSFGAFLPRMRATILSP